MNTGETGSLKTEFRVAEWRVRPELSEVERDGQITQLEPKVMALLEVFASNPGRVLSRQELERLLWPKSVVGYDALSKAVTKLRDALGDDSKKPQFIQTISKKGYRFVAPVQRNVQDRQVSPNTPLNSPPGSIKALAITLALVTLVFIFWPRTHLDPNSVLTRSPKQPILQKPVLVILPFRDISPKADHAYLVDGITGDLITGLSHLSQLMVIDSNAVLPYKDISLSPDTARNKFKARYVLRGDVLKIQDRIRVNVHLTDAQEGKVLWADRLDRKFTDLFAIQEQISQHIVDSLSLTLSQEEKLRIAQRYTYNLQAYEFFLRGQSLAAVRTSEDNLLAGEMYQRAIDIDPSFARAYAALAVTYIVAYYRQWPLKVKEPLKRALELSDHAIALDDDLPENYWVAGYVNGYQKNLDRSIELLLHALTLNPNYADAYALLGWVYICQGKPDLTIDYVAKAMRLNPSGGHLYQLQLGRANYFLHRYDQALVYFEQAHQANPTYIDTMLYMAATYMNLKRHEDAAWIYMEAKSQHENFNTQLWIENLPIIDPRFKSQLSKDLSQVPELKH